ncbi:carboxypeptidase-like regulatory domain-containing protein [Paludisphaera mucosa]|uniref:Carboxypeptidase-like regulatory domain-containing protein n=1 Tax=Paludisphaera mucosa TaxID=3030827 RepID=A0ABT6F9Q5_9BACT|nr:carboxypeptidase-like regulatory domain-containing protein [Paludisphaera mucosa]MDG3004247.1 carboxypeptidase-like regulatory domain-containing protein [Paludisphaera mucosa]
MSGATGSRYLWAGLLAPPILVMGVAGAISMWPQQVVGLMDGVARLWDPIPTQRPRPGSLMMATPKMSPATAPIAQPEIRGTIRKPDGSPLDRPYRLGTFEISRFSHSSGLVGDHSTPDFVVTPRGERTWIVVDSDDYAPALAGPIEAGAVRPGDEPIVVKLEEGFPHRVRVVDAEGAPIAGAEVHPSLTLEHRPVPLGATWFTDDDGWAEIPHVREADYEFDVKVHDFVLPDDTVFASLHPGVDTTITLDRGSTKGVAVDEQGRPAADALILVAAELDERVEREDKHISKRIIVARSDAEGRFPLPHLHKDSVHLIRAEGADGSLGFAPGVRLKDPEVRVTLRPRRMVRGFVKGVRGYATGVFLSVRSSVATGFEGRGQQGDEWAVTSRTDSVLCDEEGRFEYPSWGSIDSELLVQGRTVPVPWPPPEEPIAIDPPAPTAESSVQIRIAADASIRPIRGSMTLFLANGPPERALQTVPRLVELQDDRGTFRCLNADAFRFESSAIPGYWTSPGTISSVVGGGDRVIDVRVFAAGTIRGRVLDADGEPVAGAKIRADFDPAWAAESPPARLAGPPPRMGGINPQVADPVRPTAPPRSPEVATTDADGRFVIPAWPLNVGCRLAVESGRFGMLVDPVRPDAREPKREVEIRLPRRAKAEVRVVGPDDRPIPGAQVVVELRRAETDRQAWDGGRTDADGRVALDDLAEGETGYSVRATFDKDYRTGSAPLQPGAPALVLRVERGRTLEGRVVEAVTGWPIPGVSLLAAAHDGAWIRAEAATDGDGRFRFSVLPDGPVRLGSFQMMNLASPRPPQVAAGEVGPILVRMINLREYDPQPRRPSQP